MNRDVLAFIRTVLDTGLRADGEFALDFCFVIDLEMNGTCLLVFRHLQGEFRISYGGDLSRQRLVIGRGLRVACRRLGGGRCGPDRDVEANEKQSG